MGAVGGPQGVTQFHHFGVSRLFALWNPNNPPTDIIASNLSMAEKSPSGTVVGKLYVVDPDTQYGDSATFTLLDNAGGRFALDGSNLIAGFTLSDASVSTTQTVIVRATDSGGLTFDKSIPITIINGPDKPYAVSLSVQSIAEDTPTYQTFAALSAVVDSGDSVTFKIVSDPDAKFYISGGVNLQLQQPVDFEKKTTHSLTIRATNSTGLATDVSFVISVLNVNEAPTDVWLTSNQILGGSPAGSVVGTLGATDPDAGSTFTFAITADPDNQFQIVGNQLQVSSSPDYSVASQHTVSIRVTDQGGLSYAKSFTIYVVQPVDINLDTLTMPENVAAGTAIGTLYVTGGPPVGYTFAKTADANGMFAIDSTGHVTTVGGATLWDYETRQSASFTVTATPTSGNSAVLTRAFTIAITNVNEAPTGFTITNSSVREDAPVGTVIGVITTLDPDAGDSATLAKTSDPDGVLDLVGNQVILTAKVDWSVKTSHLMTFRITDAGGLTLDCSLTVNVTRVWFPPTNIALSNSSLPENAGANAPIGMLSVTDVNQASGETGYTYAITSDPSGKFAISGTQLIALASFNYEVDATSYPITIQANDPVRGSFAKAFTVSITNVNEAPTNIGAAVAQVHTNAATGTLVATLTAVDPDAGDTFTYAIVSDPSNQFAISGATVTTKVTPLSQGTFPVTIRVTDAGGLTFDKAFSFAIVNLAPTNITLSASSFSDLAGAGTQIGVLTGSDPENDTLTFALTTNPSSFFAISGNSLTITGPVPAGAYTATIQATDTFSNTFSKSFTLTSVNQPPTNISLSATTFDNSVASGTTIATITGVDPENDALTYSLPSNPSTLFAITGTALKTNAANIGVGAHAITIRATDSAGNTFDKAFTLTATHTDQAPTNIALSNATVNNNVAAGSVIGALTTTDPDAGDTFTYAITVNPSNLFAISGANLVTAVANAAAGTYAVTIKTTDSGGLTFSKQFSITVNYVYLAETTALCAKMTVQPTSARKQQYDQIILALKNAGIWTLLDLFYVTCSHDSQASLLNWVSPGNFTLSLIGATQPVFTVNSGWQTGQTTSTKMTTGWCPFSNASKMAPSSMSVGVWALPKSTNAQGNQITFGSSGCGSFASVFFAGSGLNRAFTSTSASPASGAPDNGFVTVVRANTTQETAYMNAGFPTTVTASPAGSTFTAANAGFNFDLGGGGSSGPGGTASTTNGTMSLNRAAFCGAALTAAQITSFYNALNTYISAPA